MLEHIGVCGFVLSERVSVRSVPAYCLCLQVLPPWIQKSGIQVGIDHLSTCLKVQ